LILFSRGGGGHFYSWKRASGSLEQGRSRIRPIFLSHRVI